MQTEEKTTEEIIKDAEEVASVLQSVGDLRKAMVIRRLISALRQAEKDKKDLHKMYSL